MNLISQLLTDAPDYEVPLRSLLLKMKIIARRIDAEPILEWVDSELTGYKQSASLPDYRAYRRLGVIGTWAGWGNQISTATLSDVGLDEEIARYLFGASFRQSVATLEEVSTDGSAHISWDIQQVAYFDKTSEARFEDMNLIAAKIMFPKNLTAGILTNIRSKIVDFALELESIDPSLADQPLQINENITKEKKVAIRETVNNFNIVINGNSNTFAAGHEVSQKITVHTGNYDELFKAAQDLGLSNDDAKEFADAVTTDNSKDGPSVRDFLERVKSGAISIGSGIAVEVASQGLLQAASGYLGA